MPEFAGAETDQKGRDPRRYPVDQIIQTRGGPAKLSVPFGLVANHAVSGVDDLVGQQQIVIKNLEKDILRGQRLSGAAILGDGEVALILDIQGLINEMSAIKVRGG